MRRTRLFLGLIALGFGLSTTQAQETQGQNAEAAQCVAVIGAVFTPQRVFLKRRMRLAEALAFAGGFTKHAGSTIEITPTVSKCPQESKRDPAPAPKLKVKTYQTATMNSTDEAMNPYLQPGDIVVVTEGDCVYIVGVVVQPREMS